MNRGLPPLCYRLIRGETEYYYFERRGQKTIRLKGEPGTLACNRAYIKALDGRRSTMPDRRTFSALIDLYEASRTFADLAPRTHAD